MLDLIHKWLYTGIGAAVLTEQKIRDLVAELEKKGDISAEEGKSLTRDILEKAKHHTEELHKTISDEVKKLSDKYGWVSRQEFNQLKERLEQLEKSHG